MYEFILRKDHKNVYNIYKDNKRIRDENDFCVKIDEENKRVVFFNAWTAHKLVNVNDIIHQLLELLSLIKTNDEGSDEGVSNWEVIKGYDEYVINIALRKKLEKYK
jgi:hypothetical protein